MPSHLGFLVALCAAGFVAAGTPASVTSNLPTYFPGAKCGDGPSDPADVILNDLSEDGNEYWVPWVPANFAYFQSMCIDSKIADHMYTWWSEGSLVQKSAKFNGNFWSRLKDVTHLYYDADPSVGCLPSQECRRFYYMPKGIGSRPITFDDPPLMPISSLYMTPLPLHSAVEVDVYVYETRGKPEATTTMDVFTTTATHPFSKPTYTVVTTINYTT